MSRRGFIAAGAILGDTIGYPINGLRAGHARQLLGPISGIPTRGDLFEDRPDRFREPGLHSALGQTLLAALSAFEPEPMGRGPAALAGARLLELAGDGGDKAWGALRSPGRPLMHSIKQWREEFPWEGADFTRGRRGSKGASAAVMGLAVVAAGRGAGDGALRDLVRLTHGRFLPLASAYAVARCAELLLECGNPRRLDAQGLAGQLTADVSAEESRLIDAFAEEWRAHEWGLPERRLSDALRPLASLLREGDDRLAAGTVLSGIRGFAPDCEVTHASHGFAAVAVPWALYRALGPHSPAAALDLVANDGGEVCTIGALAGGLLAARHGGEYFPEDWMRGVRARAIVDAAAARRTGWVEEWLAWEAVASGRESRRRAELVKARGTTPPAPRPQKPRADDTIAPPPDQAPFAPPPPEWLTRISPDDPIEKRKLKESRGRKRIAWKEERRRGPRERDQGTGDAGED